MIRSVLAVLAGIATLTVTSFAIEAVANPLLLRMSPQALPNEVALSRSLPAGLFMLVMRCYVLPVAGTSRRGSLIAPRFGMP